MVSAEIAIPAEDMAMDAKSVGVLNRYPKGQNETK